MCASGLGCRALFSLFAHHEILPLKTMTGRVVDGGGGVEGGICTPYIALETRVTYTLKAPFAKLRNKTKSKMPVSADFQFIHFSIHVQIVDEFL